MNERYRDRISPFSIGSTVTLERGLRLEKLDFKREEMKKEVEHEKVIERIKTETGQK